LIIAAVSWYSVMAYWLSIMFPSRNQFNAFKKL
jgi:hypothetical protein